MVDFNESKNTYRDTIDKSINFIGKDLDFFVAVKANLLKQTIKKFFPNTVKPRILDIGCGHGFIHEYLPSSSFDVVGVDVAAEVLELAQQSTPDASYVSYNGSTLPFESASFDIAIAICVMHHVPPSQWDAFLLEMRRVLKTKGIAIIFEHNPYNPLTRWVVSNNILDEGVVLLHSSTLKKLMIKSGFNTAKSHYFLFIPFAISIFRWIEKMLWWCPLGAQYYTIATR